MAIEIDSKLRDLHRYSGSRLAEKNYRLQTSDFRFARDLPTELRPSHLALVSLAALLRAALQEQGGQSAIAPNSTALCSLTGREVERASAENPDAQRSLTLAMSAARADVCRRAAGVVRRAERADRAE